MRRVLVLALLLFAGCASVSPDFKRTIDRLEADKDCAEMQRRFDGTNDVDEMKYIDDALGDAGCYDD